MAKIRVVLADDHQDMIAIISRTLGEQFVVVSSVGDGKQAIDAVHTLNPDVLCHRCVDAYPQWT